MSAAPPAEQTVEQVVRGQLATALGGRRGMLEAAVPTLAFTVLFLTTHELRLALTISLGASLVLLAVRLVQRSTPKFVVNSLVGIGLGAFFVFLAARRGGDADDQALAYFLPGLIYNAVYGVLMLLSIVSRWPLVGFMVGSVAGDPTEWHRDRQLVRLVVQLPLYLAGHAATDAGPMVAALGVSKIVMGWPLQLLALAGMAWLLGRNRTPVQAGRGADGEPA